MDYDIKINLDDRVINVSWGKLGKVEMSICSFKAVDISVYFYFL